MPRPLMLVILLMFCSLGAVSAQTLQLADGQVLLATVEDASGEGLRVRRLDNGGALNLRWDHLTPTCALRIKRDFALAGEEDGELTVTVTEVRYNTGGVPQVVVGKIVTEQPADMSALVVEIKGLPYRIPRKDILGMRKVEVPVTQVFTLDEFYSSRLQELAPGDAADKHVLFAEELMKVRDYDRAGKHLEQAGSLGNSRAPERIGHMKKRLDLYKESKKELDLIDGIKTARARGSAREFERGSELIAQYEKEFPKGKLSGEFAAEKKRFDDARARFMSLTVANNWRRQIRTVAERKVQEPGIDLDAVKDYAQTDMGTDIADAVAEKLGVEAEEVKAAFGARQNYSFGKRTDHYSYGIGSWLLGANAVIEGTNRGAGEDKEDEAAERSREVDRIARAIRKAMEQRRAAQGGGGGGRNQKKEQTPEDWWKDADRSERAGWLRAYYAEFGGDLVVKSAFAQPCLVCSGTGMLSDLGPGNKVIRVKCYLCQGTKFLRSFKTY
ncbi:MAG: hypothetical protein VYE77_08985 [Planctomycetota bacterium]|nr:hypothetical protein [Planctomycetota bacterium]